MTWFFDTFNYTMPVPIVEAEPGRTFVTGSGDAPGPHGIPYLMEITITQDRGETTLRLLNSGFSEDATFDDEYEGVVSGWKMALATLKQWLERHPEGRRTHRLVLQPASYSAESLHAKFHTADGRRGWLHPAVSGTSTVLVDTGRELLLSWAAREAVLGLKAFRMGPQQMLALDLSTWSASPTGLDRVAADMQEVLTRLTSSLRT